MGRGILADGYQLPVGTIARRAAWVLAAVAVEAQVAIGGIALWQERDVAQVAVA